MMTWLLVLVSSWAGPTKTDDCADTQTCLADVQTNANAVEQIARQLTQLDHRSQLQAADALDVLTTNDPYTRAALTVPYAMQQAVSAIDIQRIDKTVAHDWRQLQQSLDSHVRALDALDVDLAAPLSDDALYGAGQAWTMDTRQLRQLDDPIKQTSIMIGQLTATAQSIDPQTRSMLDDQSALVESATSIDRPCPRGPWAVMPGQSWTMGMQLRDVHSALRQMTPLLTDETVIAEVNAMTKLLEDYQQATQATVTPG